MIRVKEKFDKIKKNCKSRYKYLTNNYYCDKLEIDNAVCNEKNCPKLMEKDK